MGVHWLLLRRKVSIVISCSDGASGHGGVLLLNFDILINSFNGSSGCSRHNLRIWSGCIFHHGINCITVNCTPWVYNGMFSYTPEYSNCQTPTSLAGAQGSWVLSHLTSNHPSCATKRNSFSDDRCTSGPYLLGWALSHNHSGELTQQGFPTSRWTSVPDYSHTSSKKTNAKGSGSFLGKTRGEKD